jgi:hypothetical protein
MTRRRRERSCVLNTISILLLSAYGRSGAHFLKIYSMSVFCVEMESKAGEQSLSEKKSQLGHQLGALPIDALSRGD